MARRRDKVEEAQVQQLDPKKSPVVFLTLWLLVPMILMIGYAIYLTQK